MSVPTEYDLSQDALIGPMRDILLTAAEPPSGPEFSYPVVDQAVSTEMWSRINRNVGNGILAAGGRPFWLRNINNATNTAVVSVSTWTGENAAVMHGFYYAATSDIEVSLPMPSSGTATYYICLTYDPRKESDAEGPIALEVYTGTPPTSFGREHIVLWVVRRAANQLLSDATVEQVRPFVGGVITVNYASQLPDPNSVLFGTIGISRLENAVYYSHTKGEDEEGSSNSEWVNLLDPEWGDQILNQGYEWQGFGRPPGTKLVGNRVEVRGTVRRVSGPFDTGQNSGNGYRVMYLPSGRRPLGSRYFVCATSNSNSPGIARVTIDPDGAVYVRVSQTCAWVSLDGIQFDIE